MTHHDPARQDAPPPGRRRDYGPVQLAAYLGLHEFQLRRAIDDGLVPGPDRARGRGRWSACLADAALARAAEIRAAAGSVPDYGAVRAAEELSRRLGMEVTADAVEELASRDLIPVTGYYKDNALYDGRAVERFTDTAAAASAARDGRLLTADESAAYLRIRRSDLDHLVRAGRLRHTRRGYSAWDRRGAPTVSLYRTGDLDTLAAAPGIDWQAVRGTPRGRRSPLAALPTARRSW
jgi:hypothetical protein